MQRVLDWAQCLDCSFAWVNRRSGLQQKCLRGATWEAVRMKDQCCITVVARAPSLLILKL